VENKGAKNRYDCQTCGRSIITINADEGVTPFAISCRATTGCAGLMYSAMYLIPQTLLAEFEWFKPTKLKRYILSLSKRYDRHMKEHIRKGGLVLREIT